MFEFNRDYKDLDQVAEFYAAFEAVYDEFAAAGLYPYNDRFKGRIPGIEGPNEDTAIYLLQTLRDVNEMNAELDGFRAAGAVDVTHLDSETRFKVLVQYGFYMGGTGIAVFENVRLQPDAQGKPSTVIPKGKRTPRLLMGGRLLGIAA